MSALYSINLTPFIIFETTPRRFINHFTKRLEAINCFFFLFYWQYGSRFYLIIFYRVFFIKLRLSKFELSNVPLGGRRITPVGSVAFKLSKFSLRFLNEIVFFFTPSSKEILLEWNVPLYKLQSSGTDNFCNDVRVNSKNCQLTI